MVRISNKCTFVLKDKRIMLDGQFDKTKSK